MSGPRTSTDVTPYELFGNVPDEEWLRLHLEGHPNLPGLTGDPEMEAQAVGTSGKEALEFGFRVYRLFKALHERHAGPLNGSVLDFGCGWGRVIRFFLKDTEDLVGLDVQPKMVRVCRETNPWGRFELCNTFPPSGLNEQFDLIYAFSVFSHLSEKSHLAWLEEFRRLLKPEGVLILTTMPREALVYTEGWGIPDPPLVSEYDEGRYCFRPLAPETPHYGWALIPESYTEQWPFEVREFFESNLNTQNVIVCKKS